MPLIRIYIDDELLKEAYELIEKGYYEDLSQLILDAIDKLVKMIKEYEKQRQSRS